MLHEKCAKKTQTSGKMALDVVTAFVAIFQYLVCAEDHVGRAQWWILTVNPHRSWAASFLVWP